MVAFGGGGCCLPGDDGLQEQPLVVNHRRHCVEKCGSNGLNSRRFLQKIQEGIATYLVDIRKEGVFLDDHVRDGTEMRENVAQHTFIDTCLGVFRLKTKIHLHMQGFLGSARRFSTLRLAPVALNGDADLPTQQNLTVNNVNHVLGTTIVFQVGNCEKSIIECHALAGTSHNGPVYATVSGEQFCQLRFGAEIRQVTHENSHAHGNTSTDNFGQKIANSSQNIRKYVIWNTCRLVTTEGFSNHEELWHHKNV